MIKRYSIEQINRANDADLVDLLKAHGQFVKRVGSEYEWLDGNETVSIKDNMWFNQYERVGGTTISFVEKYMGLSFPEAVRFILNENAAEVVDSAPIHKKTLTRPKQYSSKDFKLPERNDTMNRVYGYLMNRRGIDRNLIKIFVNNGLIYESKTHHNVVFVGKDRFGDDRHAHLRSTASRYRWRGNQMGSDARYSFNWRGKGEKVFLFEAPIDMLSYINMHPENWPENNYIAACSLSSQPLVQMLEDNRRLRQVYICFDNDSPGQKAALELQAQLESNGYIAEILVPRLKDWNEDLLNSGQEEGEVICRTISPFL